ncbi:hydroxyethylthiazole kinase [Chromohalobacter sp. 296-RDG]|uniref:hydroxyethylthiazole kinase n=1 Tax=Chromohalobacter sp. 296-RDG TaxID=2994062 RepID=UPI00246849F0|nr:hydroxyethylthiazole kinase [Chromohalobacter sp. 296-RDG]
MTDYTKLVPSLLLASMREAKPLVQCITNHVAVNFSANVLLAAGASPAMVHAPEESGEFAANAGALTINIGTLSPTSLEGMKVAVQSANQAAVPWILDPVAHFATAFRRQAVADLLALRPTVIRGNASEIISLGDGHSAGQGVDSGDSVERAEEGARALAKAQDAIVAVTGATDFVTDGTRAVRIAGGSFWMSRVTAMGCALTCVVGAFTAVASDAPFDATVAALTTFAVAGIDAAKEVSGPGSFIVNFVDALYALDADGLHVGEDEIITALASASHHRFL